MYLNLIQIAESFGVAEKVVEDWIRTEGLPHTPDQGRLLFDREQVANWAAARGLAGQVGFLAPETRHPFAQELQLVPLLRAGGIWREVAAAEVVEIFSRVVAAMPSVTPPIRQLLAQRLRSEGGIVYAPVGGGFALPHLATRVALGRGTGTVALLLLRDPLPLVEPHPDEQPVTRLVFFIAPSPRAHLNLLGRLGRVLVRGAVRELVAHSAPDEEILRAVAVADAAVTTAAAGKDPEA